MRNYRSLHTGVPYYTAYGWNRPNVKAHYARCLPIIKNDLIAKLFINSTFDCV